jgi:hypothetical protein
MRAGMLQNPGAVAPLDAAALPALTRLNAARLLIVAGIALVAAGLVFGDVFAVFVLHQNANGIGERLLAATQAVAASNADGVRREFGAIGGLLENRGTKVDAHSHIINFGYLALLLSLVQPYIGLTENRKRWLAKLFITGAVMLPCGVFLIHYVGLKGSPLESIGWASIFADLGGLFVLLAIVGMGYGLSRYLSHRVEKSPAAAVDRSWSSRVLLAGGSALILAGFLHGAWYSWHDLYRLEAREPALLLAMMDESSANHMAQAAAAVNSYGGLQAEKAVNIAAHSHVIDFGLLALLLAFIQPYVYLSDRWRRRWVVVLLAGSAILPVFVFLELYLGLTAGGIADVGGLLVIIALLGMLTGVLRYTGRVDASEGSLA